MDNDNREERVKSHCNKCQHETWHDVLFSKVDEFTDEDNQIEEVIEYTVLECRGCNLVCYRERSWDSYHTEPGGEPEVYIKIYPPATLRNKPQWYMDIFLETVFDEESFIKIFDEVYIALQNKCSRLAVMGIRSLVEQIMKEKCGKAGSFKNKLQKLKESGFISELQESALGVVLEKGHTAVHEPYKPDTKEVIAALDIVENIIESIYINENKTEKLTKMKT